MKFSIWFTEMEQQMGAGDTASDSKTRPDMPDARQFAYIGCVLDPISQEHLIGKKTATAHVIGLAQKLFMEQNGREIPINWTLRAHHMTVKFKPQTADMQALQQFMGEDVQLHILNFASDEDCCAITVSTNPKLPINNGGSILHITLAHSKAVGPNYSNSLLQNKSRMIAAHDNTVLMSRLLAVKHDQNMTWPETLIPLASPSLV